MAARRGRPPGSRSTLTIADRVVAVSQGRDPHGDRPLTAAELAALWPLDRIRAAGSRSVREHLRKLAGETPHRADEYERLKKLRQRRGYEFDPD